MSFDAGINTRASNEFLPPEGEDGQLVVVLFDDTKQAKAMSEALEHLADNHALSLDDVVIVSRGDDGKLHVNQTVHHEKRTGTAKGAILGTVVGVILGGPILGLAGGAVVGRWVGKHTDMGIDNETIKSISDSLENGQSAAFIMGSAKSTGPVVDVFKQFDGTIVQTTLDTTATEKLQKALDAEKGSSDE